jgi:hypothetical protein
MRLDVPRKLFLGIPAPDELDGKDYESRYSDRLTTTKHWVVHPVKSRAESHRFFAYSNKGKRGRITQTGLLFHIELCIKMRSNCV